MFKKTLGILSAILLLTASKPPPTPTAILALYGPNGNVIHSYVLRGDTVVKIGPIKCNFIYKADNSYYRGTCIEPGGVVIHKEYSSCRVSDKETFSFTLKDKDSDEEMKFFVIWQCTPRSYV